MVLCNYVSELPSTSVWSESILIEMRTIKIIIYNINDIYYLSDYIYMRVLSYPLRLSDIEMQNMANLLD